MKKITFLILALTLLSVARGQWNENPQRDAAEKIKSLRGQPQFAIIEEDHHRKLESRKDISGFSIPTLLSSEESDVSIEKTEGSRKIGGGFGMLDLDLGLLPSSESADSVDVDQPQLEKGGVKMGSLQLGGREPEEGAGSRKIDGGFGALELDLPSSESGESTQLEPGSLRIGGGFANIPLDASHDGSAAKEEGGSRKIGGGFGALDLVPPSPELADSTASISIEEADNEPIKLIDKEAIPSVSIDTAEGTETEELVEETTPQESILEELEKELAEEVAAAGPKDEESTGEGSPVIVNNAPTKKEVSPVVAQGALRGISGGGMMPPGGAAGGANFLKDTSDEVSIRLHSTLKMQGAVEEPDPADVTRFQEITGVYFNTLFQTTSDPVFSGNNARFSMEDVSTRYDAAAQEFLVDFVSHVYMQDNGSSAKAKKEDIQRLMSNHHVLQAYLSGVKQQVGNFGDVNKVIIRVIRHVGGR